MTDPESAPAAAPEILAAAPAAPETPPETLPERPPRPRRSVPPWLFGLGFLILAAGIVAAWFNPRTPANPDAAALAALSGRIERVQAELTGAEAKLAATAGALAALPRPPDLAPLEDRIAALEKRKPPAFHPPPAAPPRPLPAAPPPAAADATQLAAAIAPLTKRIDALEQSVGPLAKEVATLAQSETPLTKRIDALEQSVTPLTKQVDALAQSVEPLGTRLDTLQASLTEARKGIAGAGREARLAAAAVALDQGRPLGTLEGAPPALARFAATAPPTLATLRLAFPAAATAERAVARPGNASQTFVQRMMNRLGDLVTLREGNKVIVGNPAEAALANAASALAAGDLAGALSALAALPAPPAAGMTEWEDQARALIAAHAALARLAGSG